MKKFVFSVLAIFMVTTICFSQSKETERLLNSIEGQWSLDNNNNVTYQKVIEIPELSKDEIYKRAESYFIYNYGSGKSVIQTQDKEAGIIIAKGLYIDVHKAQEAFVVRYIDTWHIIRIEVKEGKARVTLTLNEYDERVVDMNGLSKYNNGVKIASRYPINPDGANKNGDGKAFYYSHLKALKSLEAIDKALKEGSTLKDAENADW